MARKRKTDADQVEEELTAEPKRKAPEKVTRRDLLSTGSTLLNLACSGNPFGGFLKGKYYYLVGDSTSGKTFLSMSCFAEASVNRQFKGHRFIYDNSEDGCLMDIPRLFGQAVADRIEAPRKDKEGGPVYSGTIEELYYHLDDAIADGRPFIYVLDSMDALDSDAARDKFDEWKKAHDEGKEAAGSYGDGKAKMNSQFLRTVTNRLRDTGSILVIVSQTRDDIGPGYATKTRSGGRALKFYATVEVWSSLAGAIKKTVRKIEREIGVHVKLQVRKNRITGKRPTVQTDIFPSYGIDDIGTCIDYLIKEGWWTRTKNSIVASEFGLTGTREKIIKHVETEGKHRELQAIVGACWKEIEDACDLKRPSRY
jgi:RecA/RadA recombinase